MYVYTIVSIVWSNWWNIDQIFYNNITWIKKKLIKITKNNRITRTLTTIKIKTENTKLKLIRPICLFLSMKHQKIL